MMGKYLGAKAKVVNKTLLSFEIISVIFSCMQQTLSGVFFEDHGILRRAWDAFAQILQCGRNPEVSCLGWRCSSLGPLLHLPPRSPSTLAPPAWPPHQLERQGALLVEFEAPLVTGPEQPAQRQNVVLKEDVIQFSPSLEYSLRPGDKVLALWGPDPQRYGPGTVILGLEATDPQRAREHPEVGLKPTAQPMPLEDPEEEGGAVQVPMAASSSSTSSSSEEEDTENGLETGLPRRLTVDSTVNTDPILHEKSPRRQGGLCRPEWRNPMYMSTLLGLKATLEDFVPFEGNMLLCF
ncbi:hypothetical protein CB1_000513044 [Camelus ferus]|nr:hypothetical protein CB1_000513044 [Camelus ferus]